MSISFSVLVTEQDTAIAQDESWLGSHDHLKFLEAAVHQMPELVDVAVVWVAPGQPGYWEAATRKITAERPVPMEGFTPEYLARIVLLGIVHESLHARYSSPAPKYQRQVRRLDARVRRPVERLFNLLEDGRITVLGKAAEPDIAGGLDEFVDAAVEQARSHARANAETVAPKRPSEQLFYAVQVYALTSQIPSPLRPDVKRSA